MVIRKWKTCTTTSLDNISLNNLFFYKLDAPRHSLCDGSTPSDASSIDLSKALVKPEPSPAACCDDLHTMQRVQHARLQKSSLPLISRTNSRYHQAFLWLFTIEKTTFLWDKKRPACGRAKKTTSEQRQQRTSQICNWPLNYPLGHILPITALHKNHE